MKTYVCLFLVLFGFTQFVKADSKQEPVSKLIFLSVSPNTYSYMTRMKQNIINSCAENGHSIQKDLEKTYTDLVKCVNRTGLFIDKKQEYLKNMDDCTVEPLKKAKSCLKPEQYYYPDILLRVAKTQVNFIVAHYETIKTKLVPCVKIFENKDVRTGFEKCLETVTKSINEVRPIPSSEEAFCKKHTPSVTCFTDILKNKCPDLQKFTEDYTVAMNAPCKKTIFA